MPCCTLLEDTSTVDTRLSLFMIKWKDMSFYVRTFVSSSQRVIVNCCKLNKKTVHNRSQKGTYVCTYIFIYRIKLNSFNIRISIRYICTYMILHSRKGIKKIL